ncbi:glutaredoxin-C6-like [Macadamia integrifolia]|uniref:glutaredoxin-C6-like n=1 Tax=Macadamia integrifolia TaxID=60698 RepID=UPI001C4F6668|nr:glutaredoxin-C6-like [Macadamia integrifolia]
MQGVRSLLEGGLRVEVAAAEGSGAAPATLTIDGAETPERKIERLIMENPVVIFGRTSCCMCHVMKNLLSTLGVHPPVIELEDSELGALAAHDSKGEGDEGESGRVAPPSTSPAAAVFIGGKRLGGLESLMALHLSGQLVPLLRDVGALWM